MLALVSFEHGPLFASVRSCRVAQKLWKQIRVSAHGTCPRCVLHVLSAKLQARPRRIKGVWTVPREVLRRPIRSKYVGVG